MTSLGGGPPPLVGSMLRPFRSMRPLALSLLVLLLVSFVSFNYLGGYRFSDNMPVKTTTTTSDGVGAGAEEVELGTGTEGTEGYGYAASDPNASESPSGTDENSQPSNTSPPQVESSYEDDSSNDDDSYEEPITTSNPPPGALSIAQLSALNATATLFADFPLLPPYKPIYGALGSRARVLAGWISIADRLASGPSLDKLTNTIDTMASSLFPFLLPSNPLSTLRASYALGSKGIVIPAGSRTSFRHAYHLIGSLRRVFRTTLPITLTYAGDTDLPLAWRTQLLSQPDLGDIHFLDLLPLFNNTVLRLTDHDPDNSHPGWATKPLSILASPYTSVLLLDADAVLAQPPSVFFTHPSFLTSDALLFHDRLIFQHEFSDRVNWWRSQILHPSPELSRSKMWTDSYPEEGDSGALVLDKSNPSVLAGILHAAWQNSFGPREECTYKISYGDKETYWFGLELSGSPYRFSSHYGAMAGWPASKVLPPITLENGTTVPVDPKDDSNRVCSFTIAHTDDKGKLLWLNGSLLLSKLKNDTEFRVPTHWMLDGKWQKGIAKEDFSCMADAEVKEIPQEQREIFRQSIEVAQELDKAMELDGSVQGVI